MLNSSASIWGRAAMRPERTPNRFMKMTIAAAAQTGKRDELSKCLKRLALLPGRTASCRRSVEACSKKLKKLDAQALQLDMELTKLRTALAKSQTTLADCTKDLATCKFSLLKCKGDLAKCRPAK